MSAIRIYRSAIFGADCDGIIHGFPERTGGVSSGARASLNLGVRWGDDRGNVDDNRRRLALHAGYDPDALVAMRHAHGTAVWTVGEPIGESAAFDGLVCDRPGPVLGAFAADCVPMLFADPEARVIGAAHAGWRGAIGATPPEAAPGSSTLGESVAGNVIQRMVERGARPDRIRVALGPSIGPCCFEVGPEVVAQFRTALGEASDGVIASPGAAASRSTPDHNNAIDGSHKMHVNLRRALRVMLERAGVDGKFIDDKPPCTKCNPDRFFSYRRDGVAGGIHMAFIAMAP